jgi:hypothetical protein
MMSLVLDCGTVVYGLRVCVCVCLTFLPNAVCLCSSPLADRVERRGEEGSKGACGDDDDGGLCCVSTGPNGRIREGKEGRDLFILTRFRNSMVG